MGPSCLSHLLSGKPTLLDPKQSKALGLLCFPLGQQGSPAFWGQVALRSPPRVGNKGVRDKPVLSVGLATWVEVHTGLPEQGLAEALRAQQESMM